MEPFQDGQAGCAYFVTVKPATSVFRVLASGAGTTGLSRARYLGDYIGEQKARIVVSGGYMSSFSPPKARLVKVDGRQISSPHTTWLGAGMVCTNGGLPRIAKYDELKSTSLTDCLQSGPLLIAGGRVRYRIGAPDPKIEPGEQKLVNAEQNQAFICVAENKDIKLGVSDKIKLDDFSDFLKKKLNCHDALRLTGHFTAGLQIDRDLYGNDEFPLPSVIAVAPKGQR